jgi:hypothetical protein
MLESHGNPRCCPIITILGCSHMKFSASCTHQRLKASALNLPWLISSTGASPRGIYTSISLILSSCAKSLLLRRASSSVGVCTAIDSNGVYSASVGCAGSADDVAWYSGRVPPYLGLLACEERQEQLMVVRLNIVILRRPTVDLTFDLVSVIVENKDVRFEPAAHHGSNLLQGLI